MASNQTNSNNNTFEIPKSMSLPYDSENASDYEYYSQDEYKSYCVLTQEGSREANILESLIESVRYNDLFNYKTPLSIVLNGMNESILADLEGWLFTNNYQVIKIIERGIPSIKISR